MRILLLVGDRKRVCLGLEGGVSSFLLVGSDPFGEQSSSNIELHHLSSQPKLAHIDIRRHLVTHTVSTLFPAGKLVHCRH